MQRRAKNAEKEMHEERDNVVGQVSQFTLALKVAEWNFAEAVTTSS